MKDTIQNPYTHWFNIRRLGKGLVAAYLLGLMLLHSAHAQFAGLEPMPTVAGVPFHSNVFGAAATDAEASKSSSGRAISGMPRNVYTGHASVVLWVDDKGETHYSAAVALHSVTFSMSMDGCRKQNGGSAEKCKEVYDAATSVLAVIKASDGGFYFTKGSSKSDAKKRGMEACQKRANVTCKVDRVYGS